MAYYSQVRRMLDEVTAKSSRAWHVPRRPITFPKSEMQNTDHIIAAVARSYTERLITEIKALQENRSRSAEPASAKR